MSVADGLASGNAAWLLSRARGGDEGHGEAPSARRVRPILPLVRRGGLGRLGGPRVRAFSLLPTEKLVEGGIPKTRGVKKRPPPPVLQRK